MGKGRRWLQVVVIAQGWQPSMEAFTDACSASFDGRARCPGRSHMHETLSTHRNNSL